MTFPCIFLEDLHTFRNLPFELYFEWFSVLPLFYLPSDHFCSISSNFLVLYQIPNFMPPKIVLSEMPLSEICEFFEDISKFSVAHKWYWSCTSECNKNTLKGNNWQEKIIPGYKQIRKMPSGLHLGKLLDFKEWERAWEHF